MSETYRDGYQCAIGGDGCPGHPSKWLVCGMENDSVRVTLSGGHVPSAAVEHYGPELIDEINTVKALPELAAHLARVAVLRAQGCTCTPGRLVDDRCPVHGTPLPEEPHHRAARQPTDEERVATRSAALESMRAGLPGLRGKAEAMSGRHGGDPTEHKGPGNGPQPYQDATESAGGPSESSKINNSDLGHLSGSKFGGAS